ncbi:MAG TPA: asparagine synthase (glutamine-hydrolyzing) [Gammaproteobacteria bacterium]|nr:asparagine synthase (glutamine-hydrolyzing) [Gammaproteobacteria bacterium]
MCGIAGIWRRDGVPIAPGVLADMGRSLRHRGPDGAGEWQDGCVGFAHTRLSIVDASDRSAQPMRNADASRVLIYNGEIHNYRELRAELAAAGVAFRSTGDTEVVLASFERWGEPAFERFNGMWALAIWDADARRLVLSRDRFGIKPLYYSVRGSRIAFASEPKAILAAFPEERVADGEEVHAFLNGGSPDVGDHSFFRNIRAVRPATTMRFAATGAAQASVYWRFEPGNILPTGAGAAERFRALLDDAVRLRMRSDVPVGAALSGGLDSSAVARLAVANGGALDCFSLRYPGKPYDESGYAAAVADSAQYRMHWVEPDPGEVMPLAHDIVWHHDSPVPIRGRLPHWAVMRAASRHVRVILEGQGGDELLAGYPHFDRPYLTDRLRSMRWWSPASLGALRRELVRLNELRGGRRGPLTAMALRRLKSLLPRWPWMRFETRQFASQFGGLDPLRRRSPWSSPEVPRPFASHLNNALWLELRFGGMPESLHGADAMSMAFSIESRAPFLDHRLVEFCFALPFEEKIRDGWTKSILRRALERDLPESVLRRTHKLGFPAPYGEWLSRDDNYAAIREILLSRACRDRGVLAPAALERWLPAAPRGQAYVRRYVETVWRMLTLEIWFQKFIDAPVRGET